MRADRLKRCLVYMGGLLLGLSRPVEAHSGAVAYQAQGRYRRAETAVAAVAVNGGGIGRVAELVFPRQAFGATVEASRGWRVKTGSGDRQGSWQTLGMLDGLPSSVVLAMTQDRAGYLWFGTPSGVARYDGQWITTFTVREGLPGNNVWCVLEDRQENLWFGTAGGGVSRYDGKDFTNFATKDGLAGDEVRSVLEDRQGSLWFGTNGGVSRYDGKGFTTFTAQAGLPSEEVHSMLEDRQGNLWFGTDGGVSRYDGKGFTTFTTKEGLAGNYVTSMLEDRQGNLWVGTWGGGVSRYDGKGFTNFTSKEGLARNEVTSVLEDRQGNLWVGMFGGGLSRYEGKGFTSFGLQGLPGDEVHALLEDRQGNLWVGTSGGVSRYDSPTFRTLTVQDGLISDDVASILEDRQGNLWFGTRGAGLSRYDGVRFATFTTHEGLAGNSVMSMLEDRRGILWFMTDGGVSRYDGKGFATITRMTWDGGGYNVASMLEDRQGNLWFGTWGSGVSRYDGKGFTTINTEGGPALDRVRCMLEDRQGNLWFGTDGGVSRYDGEGFTTFTTQDGLAGDGVRSILKDRQGHLWFGTFGGGVSQYDGKGFTTLTTREGLADNMVLSMLEDRQGHLWFGTWGGGVGQFDGTVFQSLLRQDGLVDNGPILAIHQGRNGDLWIASSGVGITRYRACPAPPPIHLTEVVADRRYGPVNAIRLPSSQRFVAFEFQGISFKTRPGQIVYLYQLEGYDPDWRQTREERVEYSDLPSGEYVFRVKAVDRDLAYSEEPVEVKVTIHPPYGQLALILALVVAVVASGYGIRRRRERDQARDNLMREMEEELQTAHEMQMALMPKAPPQIPGFEITGRCLPANHVGGDLFQYFHQGQKLFISLADVTGHAMEAAIPVVMFSGVLKTEMKYGPAVERLFASLNQTLCESLEARTFVCFALGELDLPSRVLRLSNSGCPYPYHFRAVTGEVTELQVDAYPLGVRPDTSYRTIEIQLSPGDRVVFCSDGIIEATNGAGEMFGFERTAEVIRKGCEGSLSAEVLLERIMGAVKGFRGETPQGDDQTVVVVKVEEQKSA